ncbi:MAG: hypothetical protein GXP26_11175 [Planctomycetes bacterium]|nr:hypothetical protein [Planctomycetota bacterium]
MYMSRLALLRVVAWCSVSSLGLAALVEGAVAQEIGEGSGSFVFTDPEGNPDRPIKVWYHRPKKFRTSGSVVFVIHGKSRNADGYRDTWVKYAERKQYLLLCPEFSKQHYPYSRHYNLGYMVTSKGQLRDKKKWSFMAIERIFDQVVEANRLQAKQYSIYGHSGGGQFVHRLVVFLPEARFKIAVSANPGWYTMLQDGIEYPYGLGGTAVDEQQLRQSLGRRFVLLLGTADTDPNHKSLRKTPEAMAQGPHRLARGKSFYKGSKLLAKKLDVKSRWRLQTVPGVKHSNSKMSVHAAKLIQ